MTESCQVIAFNDDGSLILVHLRLVYSENKCIVTHFRDSSTRTFLTVTRPGAPFSVRRLCKVDHIPPRLGKLSRVISRPLQYDTCHGTRSARRKGSEVSEDQFYLIFRLSGRPGGRPSPRCVHMPRRHLAWDAKRKTSACK